MAPVVEGFSLTPTGKEKSVKENEGKKEDNSIRKAKLSEHASKIVDAIRHFQVPNTHLETSDSEKGKKSNFTLKSGMIMSFSNVETAIKGSTEPEVAKTVRDSVTVTSISPKSCDSDDWQVIDEVGDSSPEKTPSRQNLNDFCLNDEKQSGINDNGKLFENSDNKTNQNVVDVENDDTGATKNLDSLKSVKGSKKEELKLADTGEDNNNELFSDISMSDEDDTVIENTINKLEDCVLASQKDPNITDSVNELFENCKEDRMQEDVNRVMEDVLSYFNGDEVFDETSLRTSGDQKSCNSVEVMKMTVRKRLLQKECDGIPEVKKVAVNYEKELSAIVSSGTKKDHPDVRIKIDLKRGQSNLVTSEELSSEMLTVKKVKLDSDFIHEEEKIQNKQILSKNLLKEKQGLKITNKELREKIEKRVKCHLTEDMRGEIGELRARINILTKEAEFWKRQSCALQKKVMEANILVQRTHQNYKKSGQLAPPIKKVNRIFYMIKRL